MRGELIFGELETDHAQLQRVLALDAQMPVVLTAVGFSTRT